MLYQGSLKSVIILNSDANRSHLLSIIIYSNVILLLSDLIFRGSARGTGETLILFDK